MPKTMPFDRLQRTTLSEEATRQIKKSILGGEYRPGDHLAPEKDLAEALGVGRPTVREALKILKDRGLIELDQANRRYVVQSPDLENCVRPVREQISWLIQVSENTIGDFWAVIPHVVGLAAHAALDTAAAADLQRLAVRLDEMEKSGLDFQACCRASYRFGLDLAAMTGNRLIMLLWKIFEPVIQEEFPPILSVMEPEGPQNLVLFHGRVLDGLRKGSESAIHKAVVDRVKYLKTRLPGPGGLIPDSFGRRRNEAP